MNYPVYCDRCGRMTLGYETWASQRAKYAVCDNCCKTIITLLIRDSVIKPEDLVTYGITVGKEVQAV